MADDKCKTAVWNEDTGRCSLKKNLEEMIEKDGFHSLIRVGFVNGTGSGESGCSQREIDEKCADLANLESAKAKAECLKQVNDAQRDALKDRTDRERAEREHGESVARLEQSLRDTKRECRENLETERAERDRAVRAERERIERKARVDQAKAVQEERERLMKEFSEQLRTEKEACALTASKCAADREQALQAERDRLGKECNEKLRLEQILSSNKCAADLRNEQDRFSKDCDERLRLEQVHSDSKCASNLRNEQDRMSKECSEKLRLEKEHVESKCSADLGRVTEERDRLIRQCSDDLRSAKEEKDHLETKCKQDLQEKDRLETKCKQDLQEKDRLETKCKQDLQEKDRLETKCKQDLQEKDRIAKECTDGRAQEQIRRKDDICYNPGFGAWPNTISTFDIDGTAYVVQPNSHLTLAFPTDHETTSPASCARDFCNNEPDCVGVEWTPNDVSNPSFSISIYLLISTKNKNKCITFNESRNRPIKKDDIRSKPPHYMIIKPDRLR